MGKRKRKRKIKIEKWGNKKFVVVRDNGKIKSYRERSKDFTLKDAKQKFSQDKTLVKDKSVYDLPNLKEYTDYSENPKVKSNYGFVQYMVTGFYIDNKKQKVAIASRSQQYSASSIRNGNIKLNDMKEEARLSFHERISEASNDRYYDEDIGIKIVQQGRAKIVKEGLIYYEAKN